MASDPHREAPQPRRSDDGVAWCQSSCPFFHSYEDDTGYCMLMVLPADAFTAVDTLCIPAARADAAELARLREEVEDHLQGWHTALKQLSDARTRLAELEKHGG